MRISFWDRYFYGIEYFVQQMNKRFSFITDKSTHAKQFYFQEMLNFFGLGAETYNINDIFIELNNHFPEGNSDFIQSAERNKKQTLIPYVKFYEYAATMRNSLHNNGFSNKTLNNLDLGVVSYQNIKAGEMINCLSAFHVLILSFPLTQIIQKVVEKTLILAPNELIFDPYTKGLDDFINRNT
jgi:hypothetical protein